MYDISKPPDGFFHNASRPMGTAFTPGASAPSPVASSQGGGAVIGGGMFGASWGSSSQLDTGKKGFFGGF